MKKLISILILILLFPFHVNAELRAVSASSGSGSSGTVNSGTTGQVATYATTGTAVSGSSSLAIGTQLVQAGVQISGVAPTTVAISTLTFTPNLTLGNIFSFTLADSPSNVMANPSAGVTPGATGVFKIVQSSAGTDAISTWGTSYKFQGGVAPTLSTGANQIDMLSYVIIDATHINISLIGTNYQ